MTVWLAVDAGEERTGIAAGSDVTRLALPLCIIERKGRSLDRLAAEIAALAVREAAEAIVVGLPLNMDGSEGFQAARARSLGRRLALTSGLPLTYWDERMSSFIAEQAQERASVTGAGRRRTRHTDDLAAAVILQRLFDADAHRGPDVPADACSEVQH
ncbi:MAG: Holliday junction resolvase RuvX [Dehalococcoidia bacterium]